MTAAEAATAHLRAVIGTAEEPAARRRLAETCLALATYIATPWMRRRTAALWILDHDDILSAAYTGLAAAAASFDVNRSLKFTTYAGCCMKNAIINEVRKRGEAIAIPNYLVEEKRSRIRQSHCVVHLSALRYRDGNNAEYILDASDWSVPDDTVAVDEADEYQAELRKLKATLAKLPRQDRELLWRRARGESLQALANEHGVTKERIRQKQVRALARAKSKVRAAQRRAGKEVTV